MTISRSSSANPLAAHHSDSIAILDDQQLLGSRQLLILILFFTASMVDGFDLQSIGFLAPIISKAFNIQVALFGAVFSAGMLGLGIGSIVIGQISDTVGRRRSLIIVLFCIGVFSILTAFVTSREQLIVIRFLTSLGLGGSLPILSALTSECSPRRFQKISLCLLFAAVPAGGLAAGLVGGVVLPIWGWPSVFVVGGIAPILLSMALLLAFRDPNNTSSFRDPLSGDVKSQRVRFWPAVEASKALRPASMRRTWFLSLSGLFEKAEWRVTLPLWMAYFSCLLVLYFIVNWIPALLIEASFEPSLGIWAVSTFSFGGILGTLVQGPLLTRFGSCRPVLIQFAIAAILIAFFANITLTRSSVAVLTFAIGWTVTGAQAGLNTFTATHYRTDIRATAMGWGLASGRLGSIVGALLGGLALGAGLAPRSILLSTSIPLVIGAVAFSVAVIDRKFPKL